MKFMKVFAELVSITMICGDLAVGSAYYSNYCSAVSEEVVYVGTTYYGEYMYNEDIKKVIIDDSATEIGNCSFYACPNLESVYIGKNVEKMYDFPFGMSFNLKEINVSKDNSTYCSNEGVVFTKDMKELLLYPPGKDGERYTIPDGVSYVGYGAFFSSQNLKEIILPDSVVEIAHNAFVESPSLETLTFPSSLEKVGGGIITNCYNFKKITFLNPNCEIYGKTDEFGTFTIGGENVTICGYEGSTAQVYAKKFGYEFESLGKVPQNTPSFGDPTGDGKIDANDASFTLVEYSKLSTGGESMLSDEVQSAADVNKDGKVDSKDASTILAYYSYLSTGGTELLIEFLTPV